MLRKNIIEKNSYCPVFFRITDHKNKSKITTSKTKNNIAIKRSIFIFAFVFKFDLFFATEFAEIKSIEIANILAILKKIITDK